MGFGDFLNSLPVVGHIKGVIHYLDNDKEAGNRAMLAASRTSAVIGAGAVGIVGGPVLAGVFAAEVGAGFDIVTAIASNGKHVNGIMKVAENPKDPKAYLAAVVDTAGDALTGGAAGAAAKGIAKAGAGQVAKQVVRKTANAGVNQAVKHSNNVLFRPQNVLLVNLLLKMEKSEDEDRHGNHQATAPKSTGSGHRQSGNTANEAQSKKAQQSSQYGNDDSSDDERRNDPPKDRRNQDQTNRTVVRDELGRVVLISTIVRLEDLGSGSATTKKIRDRIKQIGRESDVAGHILAKMLGGSGSDEDNIVPMSRDFNNKAYKSFEFDVRKLLKTVNEDNPGQQVEARINIHLMYYANSKRPYKIKYCVDFYVNGVEKHHYSGIFYVP